MEIKKKSELIKRKQTQHTISQQRILKDINHPFITSLLCSFQNGMVYIFCKYKFNNLFILLHYT